MNTPEVRLSTVDRVIGISTLVNTYKTRKLTEQILLQQNKTNFHLQDLRRQMSSIDNQLSEANRTSKQILAHQLKEEENKALQKFYKAFSFYLFETIEVIRMIEDKMVLNYVINHFYDNIKSSILEANDQLDELSDKAFNKQALEKLDEIKFHSDMTLEGFKLNILYTVDNLISDYKIKYELLITTISKPGFKFEILTRKRTNVLRTFGVVIIGFFFVSSIASSNILFMFLFGIPFAVLLIKELKWEKEYDDFFKNQIHKQQEFSKNKVELEQEYQDKLQKEKEKLLDHPLHNCMLIVNKEHPTFEKTVSEITELEKAFAKKWGVVEEAKTKNAH